MSALECFVLALLVVAAILSQSGKKRARSRPRRRAVGGLPIPLIRLFRSLGLLRAPGASKRPYTCGVYVLSNPSMPGKVKVGFTRRNVRIRISELSRPTGVPEAFELEAFFPTTRPERDEARVHRSLRRHRVGSKEFFDVEPAVAIQRCRQIVGPRERARWNRR